MCDCASSGLKNKRPADLTGCGSLGLQSRRSLELHSRIVLDHNFRRIVLTIDRQLQIVGSGLDDGSEVEEGAEAAATTAAAAATESWRRVGWPWRNISAQIPLDAIASYFFRAPDRADHFALVI